MPSRSLEKLLLEEFMKKHKNAVSNKDMFEALYDYFTAQEHYTNHGSNFSACIAVVSEPNVSTSVYMVATPKTAASTWPYIISMHNASEYISKIRIARKILYSMSKENKENLMLAFYGSPGKFSFSVRNRTRFVYQNKYVDLSALVFKLSKAKNIEEFETLNKDNEKKLFSLYSDSKRLFTDALNEYYLTWKKNQKEN